MDIFSNFIPNKFVTLDDQDPSWIKDLVKTKIKLEKQLYNTQIEIVMKIKFTYA